MLMWPIIIDLAMNIMNSRVICDKTEADPTKSKLKALLASYPGATLAIKKDCIYVKLQASSTSVTVKVK